MRVECPGCAALYEIPDHFLDGGARKLRCARCGHEWLPAGAPEPVAPVVVPAPALPAPAHADREERLAPPPVVEAPVQNGAAIWLAWLATVIVILGAACAAWMWRAPLSQAWPPARQVFDWVGRVF